MLCFISFNTGGRTVWLYGWSRTVRKGSFLTGGCALSMCEGSVAWVK